MLAPQTTRCPLQTAVFPTILPEKRKDNMKTDLAVQYRPAKAADVDEITSLIKAAVAEMERHGIYQWDALYPTASDFLSDIQSGSLFVGQVTVQGLQRIALVYAVNRLCDEAYNSARWKCSGSYLIIHRLCVHPDFQRQGLAKEALSHIERQAAGQGIQCLRLDVFSQNPFSLQLYSHAGFYKTGEANWRKGFFYLMEKEI